MGPWTYGYYRVMELLAWTYCARAIAFFNDLPALLIVFGFALAMQAFRMWSEQRDVLAAIATDEDEAAATKRLVNIHNSLNWGLHHLKIFTKHGHTPDGRCLNHSSETPIGDPEDCYTCHIIKARDMITAAQRFNQENKK